MNCAPISIHSLLNSKLPVVMRFSDCASFTYSFNLVVSLSTGSFSRNESLRIEPKSDDSGTKYVSLRLP
ncbi:hypothetical protein GLOIN_2v1495721 [Rhizophagus irregularis DAOM 181602=DAOM 197198]|uniref:Uncharacterized protein n=1 Tax=Rhizophagus irregularis (strain DAOM 181602 / DAOM 197198 / MUCL 43194) TaxID=747089 RepID=A0A2P4QXZ7_RHIID|nr:hypothetical protein GLOIN_2v1495721 [Rhizophagus irregularis DAOM 181602=DAOM 197198]POG82516.1 hypothetical protein GLOIN_2v1495721 [Rhizophagus irregularis DAOM 181602=DAOM 197198]|eukprot:XP_025189382.1 hypothetical protein GLOIN_2v1495721 [Rhizophagus irregularis DAOM 181602=DAOM 197198]